MDGLRFCRPVRAVAAGTLMSALACAICAAQPVVRPAWASSPPVVDGNVSAAAWQIGTPVRFGGSDSTEALLLEDARYLYVGIRAVQHETVSVNGGDSVDLVFSGASGSTEFWVNPLGETDAKNAAWDSVGRVLPDGYEITMRIPRTMLAEAGQGNVVILRHVAAVNGAQESQKLAFSDAAGPYAPISPASVVAGKAGRFSNAYQSLWPSKNAPQLPGSAAGVAVKRSEGNVTVAALDAQTGGREDDAQSLAYTTPDKHLSTTVQRVQSSQSDVHDVTQSVSVQYRNGSTLSVSGGVASDRATTSAGADSGGSYAFTDAHYDDGTNTADFSWSNAGADFDPQDEIATSAGTNGFTADASRKIGAVKVQGSANAYRDDVGTLVSSEQQASVAVPVGKHLSAGISSASEYSSGIGAFNESGLHLGYENALAQGGVDYRTGSYDNGVLQDAGLTAGFTVPEIGDVGVQSRVRNFLSFGFPATTELLDAVRVTHHFGPDSVSLSYRNVQGELPSFLAGDLAGSGVSFSVDRYFKIGLLHFSYNESDALSSAHSFAVKIIPGAKP